MVLTDVHAAYKFAVTQSLYWYADLLIIHLSQIRCLSRFQTVVHRKSCNSLPLTSYISNYILSVQFIWLIEVYCTIFSL